ncbi:ArsR family transcriptional regulator [Pseudomonas sp. MSSRFD41]|uniref:VpaChn25_0724 family phage protein n=1 Tax=Pseudomonas sp. MSSRFD41 TaxID=1310370 RepID=UPI00163B0A61|nr:ArsR family transcriptional regulator [Pseudomonas sp. MSSRFD41]MBC2658304.1 ArsR family transcriptional regulator [Pseudomonas sp. MSSRFD41]
MTQYAEFLRQDYRLVILRLLGEMGGYRANSSVLTMALDRYGHTLSRDQVKTELHWLAEQGALTLADVGPVLVATLTERGQDIAAGRARVPGIKRPGA